MPEAKTFADDLLGRLPFADRLLEEIQIAAEMWNEALVVSLNAPFGAGKTTFLKMWKCHLEGNGFEVLELNAWASDFAKDPILPIASTFAGYMKRNHASGAADAVVRASKKVVTLATLGVSQLLPVDAVRLLEDAEKLDTSGDDILRAYQAQMNQYQNLHSSLEQYVAERESASQKLPLFVFVDELDRARPDYAIEFLEAIKHIYSVRGIVYVVAMDRDQLESTVKARFGGGTDFSRYLKRFIQLERNLPSALVGKLYGRRIEDWVSQLAQEICSDDRNPISPGYAFDWARRIVVVMEIFEFEARDLEHLVRHLRPLLRAGRTFRDIVHIELLTFLVGLYLADRKTFERVRVGDISFSDARRYVMSRPSRNPAEQRGVALSFVLGLANVGNQAQFGPARADVELRALIDEVIAEGDELSDVAAQWYGKRVLGESSAAQELCEKILIAQSLFE